MDDESLGEGGEAAGGSLGELGRFCRKAKRRRMPPLDKPSAMCYTVYAVKQQAGVLRERLRRSDPNPIT